MGKFSFIYRIVDGSDEERVYAQGKSVMVLFDYRRNKAVPIPKDFLEKFSLYREDRDPQEECRGNFQRRIKRCKA